jgi:hypothetical protein
MLAEIPLAWLIIFAVSVPGGIVVEKIPFNSILDCQRTIEQLHEHPRADWVESNTVLICASTGAPQ